MLKLPFFKEGSVVHELKQMITAQKGDPNEPLFFYSVQTLEAAKAARLDGLSVVAACFDIAATRCHMRAVQGLNHGRGIIFQFDHNTWNDCRRVDLESREVEMNLYPEFFEQIALGWKTYEGRAWKKNDVKNYEGLREGDTIVFTQIDRSGKKSNTRMRCEIGQIVHGTNVYDAYLQTESGTGIEFQPAITGNREADLIRRVSVYYEFPGYYQVINSAGFLGIRVRNPKLL